MDKYKSISREKQDITQVSPLLAAVAEVKSSKLPSGYRLLNAVEKEDNSTITLVNTLQRLGYRSIFDIAEVSKQRFIKRHNESLSGHAEVIFDKAVSAANQLVQSYRQRQLRDYDGALLTKASHQARYSSYSNNDVNDKEKLPDYSSLFPEPWDSFCQPNAIESLDSPVNYLLDLYKFVQQIELDGSNNAVGLEQRRADIPDLLLNSDNLYKEITAISIVNDVLSKSAREYIDQTGQAEKPVNQVLGETRFPFTLPYSLPSQQINKGLAEQETELGTIIQQVNQQFPWHILTEKRDQALLAYTQLSKEQMTLLTEKSPFAQNFLSREQLINSYFSTSTTEVLPEHDVVKHAYIIHADENVTGPTLLSDNVDKAYDEIVVTCENKAKETIKVKLRGENVLTYNRIKARMEPFDNSSPFSRQLKLTYVESDNSDIGNLDNGPFFGEMTVYAAIPGENTNNSSVNIEGINFLTMTYRFAIAKQGTAQSELLPEAEQFFQDNYGVSADESVKLKEILSFGQQTGSKVTDLEHLFNSGDFRPLVSPNVVFSNPIFDSGQTSEHFPAPYHYGGIYINAGQLDALSIVRTDSGREIDAVSDFRYDRMNRFIRLQRWLALPYHQLDLLVISAIKAESNNTDLAISNNTLRSLGLFRHLSTQYKVLPEAFAGWIYRITPFAISNNIPFFDQLFNQSKLFDQPLILDGKEFNYTENQGDGAKTVKQLCAGLAISLSTFQVIAPIVENALKLSSGKLVRNLDVVSRLYRLVTIPRLFGFSAEDGLILADILTDKSEYLANIPALGEKDDILSIIAQMEVLTSWLTKTKLTPIKLSLLLGKTQLPVVPTSGMLTFYKGISEGLTDNVCLQESDFNRQEINNIDWWTVLSGENGIFDKENGLIKDIPLIWGKTDEESLRKEIEDIVTNISPDDNQINIVVQIILQAKTAQESLLSSAIAGEYGVSRDIVPLQLRWLGSSVYSVLKMVLDNTPEKVEDIKTEFLDLTYSLLVYTQLINALSIGNNLLLLRLTNPKWLGLNIDETTEIALSLDEIFLLNRYQDLLENAKQNEDKVQEYFTFANSEILPKTEEDDNNYKCAQLLAEILDWSPDEIYLACDKGGLERKRAITLSQIDWIRRLQQFSVKTHLSVEPLLGAAALDVNSDFEAFQSIGEAVMAALKAQGDDENV
ncbi:toxin [Photorhabdus laumondii subsp. laumondii]|uniref:Insecticidal toxin complex protein TccA2 n=2 Tax=Photorhabdus laumondii subsp. laumondii TaxID=141679 RepID=Q7N492_PHOLL|nr:MULTISPECIES: Tc toxin subunit A [Photorhabdus]AXG47530.1 toxin [Photorhabdus laumondii subsp. laumondii]KTL59832.1 toxin [Photorhabdus laumondii subsp. laumondii]MCC8385402.1 toxin [Photorhabdus laumondii]MCC8414218.1 toxin [Photorhabdus laumondii]NDK95895.1 toxin [Photorhabdus laumondii subsp. laumondii]